MKKYLLGLISTLLLVSCGQSDPVTPQAGKPNKETKESKDSKEPPTAPKHYMEQCLIDRINRIDRIKLS